MGDGPGEMQGLASWLHHNEPSSRQTNAAVSEVQCKQLLKTIAAQIPEVADTIAFLKIGRTCREVVHLLDLPEEIHFASKNGTIPHDSRRYHPVAPKRQTD